MSAPCGTRSSLSSLTPWAVCSDAPPLDVVGLAYAGGEWDSSKYQTIIPDTDNILPICDDDSFADHCKTYQKRPIYWLFDSGKKNDSTSTATSGICWLGCALTISTSNRSATAPNSPTWPTCYNTPPARTRFASSNSRKSSRIRAGSCRATRKNPPPGRPEY